MAKIESLSSGLGLASLNISRVNEKDRGWYNCKVLFLNRGAEKHKVRKYKIEYSVLLSIADLMANQVLF